MIHSKAKHNGFDGFDDARRAPSLIVITGGPGYMDAAARTIRYHRQVLIAPLSPAIYGQDTERKQTLEEATLTFKAMVETYTAYGYELIELPKVSVADRVRFVIDRIPQLQTRT